MEAVRIDHLLAGASLVVTGEGRTDGQTLAGKVPMGVARRAAMQNVPAVCISGAVTPDADELIAHNIVALLSIVDGPLTLDEAMARAAELLERAAARALRLVRVGIHMGTH
jgi:glycerate kinase